MVILMGFHCSSPNRLREFGADMLVNHTEVYGNKLTAVGHFVFPSITFV